MLVSRDQDLVVLALKGEIMFGDCLRIKQSLHEVIQESDRYFVIDLSEVPFMDSAGLGLIVSLLKMAAERGGRLALASPQQGIRRLFHMTRCDQVIPLYDTVEEAVKSIKN